MIPNDTTKDYLSFHLTDSREAASDEAFPRVHAYSPVMYAERSSDARAFHEAFPQRAGGGARCTEHARDPASTDRTPLTGIRSSDAPRVNTAHATHEPHVTRNGGPHTYSMGYCDASSCWGRVAQVHAAWLLLLLRRRRRRRLLLLSCHTEVLRHTHSAAMPLCRQLQVGGALLPFAKAAPHPVYHHLVVHACKHHWRWRWQGRCGKCGPFCLTHDVRVLRRSTRAGFVCEDMFWRKHR